MSNVLDFQHKRLVRAADLSDRHMGRIIRIGDVEGALVGLIPGRNRIDVALALGRSRAHFLLAPDAEVEVGPKSTKENP